MSGGIRRLYRHVGILSGHGIPAAILHEKKPFVIQDAPAVPIKWVNEPGAMSAGDILVIPEGMTQVMEKVKDMPIRRVVIALNWSYIYPRLPDRMDWRNYNIERVITHIPLIADMIRWSTGIPADVFGSSIDPALYFYDPDVKRPKISYIKRKAKHIRELRGLLYSRDPSFLERIEWDGLDGLPEEEYARRLRESMAFLALGEAEGLNRVAREAWRCGAVVAGHGGVGEQETFIASGPDRNCVLAENGDYVRLAMAMEPLLRDMLEGRMENWRGVIRAGRKLVSGQTPRAEETSVLDLWKSIL